MKPIQLHILSHDVVKYYFFINKQLGKLQHDICIALNCGTLDIKGLVKVKVNGTDKKN